MKLAFGRNATPFQSVLGPGCELVPREGQESGPYLGCRNDFNNYGFG